MPWRPIQTGTAGWLSLLGLKNLGRNPDEFLEQVRPTTEMAPWWLRASAVAQPAVSGTIAANVDVITHASWTAAENQWLWIESMAASISGTPVAGMGVRLSISQLGGHAVWLTEFTAAATWTDGTARASVGFRDLWVPPGYAVHLAVSGTAADTVYNWAGRVARLRN